jgi:hypothetical protein
VACGAPGRIPLSGETVTLGGLRLILSRELDDVELLMAGQTARLICGATGITEEIETDVRKALAAEEEAEKRRRPLLRDRDGTVWPNPLNPDLPSAAPQGRPAPPRTVQESRIVPAPGGRGIPRMMSVRGRRVAAAAAGAPSARLRSQGRPGGSFCRGSARPDAAPARLPAH